MSIAEDWEGNPPTFPAVDEADITLSNAPSLSPLGSLFKTGSGNIKFDDISIIEPSLGGTFACRCSGLIGSSASPVWVEGIPLDKPTISLRVRVDPGGSLTGATGKGLIIATLASAGTVIHIVFAEGGMQFLETTSPVTWRYIDVNGDKTNSAASADKTLWSLSVPFNIDVVFVTYQTYDVFINGSKINNTPIITRDGHSGVDSDTFQIGKLNTPGDIWLGDLTIGIPISIPVSGGGDPFL